MKAHGIHLVETCSACPEQYDAFTKTGKRVGYLRLRHGYFSVRCPNVSGEIVYSAQSNGDGMFEDDEREEYLDAAKTAIAGWVSKNMESKG